MMSSMSTLRRRLLPLVLVALVGAACAAPDPDASGADLYGRWCSECHGDSLQGAEAIALGPGSEAVDVSDEAIREHIREGDPEVGMPAFNLSSGQLDEIIRYVRAVQAGAAP